MNKRTPISAIMSTKVITLQHTDDLETAERMFKSHRIRHIPVVKGDSVVGMLTYTDIMRISFGDSFNEEEQTVDTAVYNMFSIDQVMTKKVVHVSSDSTIKETALILSQKDFHAIPVIDDGKLVGIVTTTDLINYLLDQF